MWCLSLACHGKTRWRSRAEKTFETFRETHHIEAFLARCAVGADVVPKDQLPCLTCLPPGRVEVR